MGRFRLRVFVLALYLLQGGILLPLHHHDEGLVSRGPILASGCHQGLPCSDPGHRHPPAPSEHPKTCVACAAAIRPALAAIPFVLPVQSLTASACETAQYRPAPTQTLQSRRPRAPPADLLS